MRQWKYLLFIIKLKNVYIIKLLKNEGNC